MSEKIGSKLRIFSDLTELLSSTKKGNFLLYSANYHISAISGGSADGRDHALSFNMLLD